MQNGQGTAEGFSTLLDSNPCHLANFNQPEPPSHRFQVCIDLQEKIVSEQSSSKLEPIFEGWIFILRLPQ